MKPQTKTAFVLSRPNLTINEIIAEARTAGLKITYGHVANIRSTAKRKGGKPNGVKKLGRPPKAAASSTPETRFLDLALDLGLARADQLLKNVRAMARV